ncbi:MAG TPA: TonB-dependent receptor, partial [Gemmatimonadales bacterium]|nr:TonB-dependent receptor [Gemmatimonadales bacterium]
MPHSLLGRVGALAALSTGLALRAGAQQRDSTPHPADSLRLFTLPPAVVSVTRANTPFQRIPQAVTLVDKAEINRARPSWGLDEALTTVPGVYAANRFNFSLDQRISIRGFGARAQFAVRGIKVLVDGIPQTLPDGQGQLTNLELGEADRIEVLRGPSSALFGNATGGVISIWTDPTRPTTVQEDLQVTAGTFDRDLTRTWSKWRSSTAFRVGAGGGFVTLSRLDYTGQRQHSDADIRNLNSRWHFPLANGWSLAAVADVGWDPRADNPGALTSGELAVNPDSAAKINLTHNAGKDVTQGQAGATLHRAFADGGDVTATVFGFTRDLKNPQTFA